MSFASTVRRLWLWLWIHDVCGLKDQSSTSDRGEGGQRPVAFTYDCCGGNSDEPSDGAEGQSQAKRGTQDQRSRLRRLRDVPDDDCIGAQVCKWQEQGEIGQDVCQCAEVSRTEVPSDPCSDEQSEQGASQLVEQQPA
jgi:hypothetical protein